MISLRAITDIKSLNRGIQVGTVHVSGLVYADDVVMIASTPTDLQTQLDMVHTWCYKWRLRVNTSKTKIMHLRRKTQPRSNYQFHIGDQIISYCDRYRYLGLDLNEHMDYSHCVNIIAGAGGRALGGLISRYYQMHGLHYDTFTKLYHSLVTPVLDYASAIWGFKDHQKVNTVQHRAMRCFLGVGKYTAIPALYGEMCWKTSGHRRHLEMIRYFVRLMNMNHERLPYKVFMWDYHRAKHDSWCHEIKTILTQCDMGHVYDELEPLSRNLVSCVDKDLQTRQQNDWLETRMMPKLRHYVMVRQTWEVPLYVKTRLSRTERSYIAKLLCGNMPLKVETGRYRNTPLENRLCTYCDKGEIEDEVHFLNNCDLYTDLRTELLHEPMNNATNYEQYVTTHRTVPPKTLAQYIINAMNRRKL